MAVVKASPGSHPLIENVMRIIVNSQNTVVARAGVPKDSMPFAVVPPTGQPLLGSPERLVLAEVGDHFVA